MQFKDIPQGEFFYTVRRSKKGPRMVRLIKTVKGLAIVVGGHATAGAVRYPRPTQEVFIMIAGHGS